MWLETKKNWFPKCKQNYIENNDFLKKKNSNDSTQLKQWQWVVIETFFSSSDRRKKKKKKTPEIFWTLNQPIWLWKSRENTEKKKNVMLSWTFSTGRWLSGWIGTNVSVHHASSFTHAKSNGRGATTGLAARHYGTYCGRNGAISAYRRTIWTYTGTSSTPHHILVVSTKRTRYLHVQFIVQVSQKLIENRDEVKKKGLRRRKKSSLSQD